MGKDEVLLWLGMQRAKGVEEYYTYIEVHQGMRYDGIKSSYVAVWRSMNSLWSDGLLEATFEGTVVRRTARFRAIVPTGVRGSGMKKVTIDPWKWKKNRSAPTGGRG